MNLPVPSNNSPVKLQNMRLSKIVGFINIAKRITRLGSNINTTRKTRR